MPLQRWSNVRGQASCKRQMWWQRGTGSGSGNKKAHLVVPPYMDMLNSFLKIGVLPKEGLLALVGSIGKHTQSFQIIQNHSSTYLPPCVMNGIFLNDASHR